MKNEEIKSTLLKALREAGEKIKGSLCTAKDIQKKEELSLVTKTDCECEQLIIKIIRQKFPDHAIMAEESPPQGVSPSRWIIDPIDGTTNFAHTFPHCCVSIGFEENGTLEAGGVYDPFRDELFFAEASGGATLNGSPIAVSKTPALSESLLATGFPYDRREKVDAYLAVVKAFMLKVHGIRRGGSAALDLCYVACGRFDGFWEKNLNAWDKAAGILIIQEAGGRLTNFSGGPMTLEGNENLVSNGLIHDEMLEILRTFIGSNL